MNNLPSIAIESPAHLVQVIQNLSVGSFEKKYGSQKLSHVINAFGFVTQDLSCDQINLGINTLIEMGFCPDAVLFRRWCLGQKTFDNTDAIADSYIGKHGALAQIIKWQQDPKTPITVAQKEAYDDTYHLWTSIHSSGDTLRAELAYKDAYEQIVLTAIANKIPCQAYVPQAALQAPSDEASQTMIADSDFVKQNLAKLRQMMAGKLGAVA